MDDSVASARKRRLIIGVVVAVILLAALFAYQRHRAQQEEYQTSLGLARVLSATFEKQDKLTVGEVRGALDVTTVDPGLVRFLRSAQKVSLPYSVS